MPCTPRRRPSWQEKMALISKKKLAYWPCPGRQYISRSYGTTTARRFVLSHSRGRHGATPNSEVRWAAQVGLALGRTVCHQQSSQEQLVLSDRLHQRHSAQRYVRSRNRAVVEHRAFVPVL